ncbi:uroporphyrinogen decarboxylase [Motilibacter rhizosphaerae]|uniref:Uroporphyrinogen decarboxylase n=1 Tax=Motilibacter rhizosphaerae TaxID=598652 RepID=A0A4Q7NRP2_9ACTN|nr:uroporphyrinogen decarboxylase [Motilibacter rhizosphaerae]RZS89510.1 uroporphyrinogen decarboxylase [Motilibacter rhizosphaerae]
MTVRTAAPVRWTAVQEHLQDSPLLVAAGGGRPERTPVWFMRQAGRSLPEYLAVREGVPMLESCARPDLVTEITLQPVRRYGVDAAIFYSDIVVPLKAVGVDLDIKPGVGPVIADPVRTAADLQRLRPLEPGDVAYVTEAVRSLVGELGSTPLIGFAGAPFTLATYLVEGGPSKEHARTKALMLGEPELWAGLMSRLAAISAAFLRVQVDAGASAVQLFDSWAGVLPRRLYEEHVAPWSAQVLGALEGRVPRITFGVGTGELLGSMAATGAEVVGVDFRVPLDEAARRAAGKPLQGNLDPAVLLAPWPVVEREVLRVLDEARDLPGHVFNLGHGVLPASDPDVLRRVVELVHERTGTTAG